MSEPVVRVLTLWEPWATLLAFGIKKNETRPNHTSHVGEPYLIHSAQKWSKLQQSIIETEPFKSALSEIGIHSKDDFHFGHIIGQFEVSHCARVKTGSFHYNKEEKQIQPPAEPELSYGDYSHDRSVWIGKKHQRTQTPIPYKGGQGYYQRFKGDYQSLEFIGHKNQTIKI